MPAVTCSRTAAAGRSKRPSRRAPSSRTGCRSLACMRSHGVGRFPDPTAQGQLTVEMVQAQGIDVHSPAVLQAVQACLPGVARPAHAREGRGGAQQSRRLTWLPHLPPGPARSTPKVAFGPLLAAAFGSRGARIVPGSSRVLPSCVRVVRRPGRSTASTDHEEGRGVAQGERRG